MVMYKHETRKKHNLYKRQKCTESTKRSQNAVAKIKKVEKLPLWSNEILQEQKHIQFGPYKAKKKLEYLFLLTFYEGEVCNVKLSEELISKR